MPPADRIVFACSCEGTMPLDAAALARGCGGKLRQADQLCGREFDRFKSALGEGVPTTVGCTQMTPVFAEAAAEAGASGRVAYGNIRENAGWSREADAAGPKM